MRKQIRKLIKEALLRESQDLTLKNGTVLRNFKPIFKGLTTNPEASFINQMISVMESYDEYRMHERGSKAYEHADSSKGIRVKLIFNDLTIAKVFENHIRSSGLYNPGSMHSTQISGPGTAKPGQIFYLKFYNMSLNSPPPLYLLTFVIKK